MTGASSSLCLWGHLSACSCLACAGELLPVWG